MEFVVRAHSVEMDEATREYAEAKIGKAVAKMTRGRNARVDVEISDATQGSGQTRVKVHVVIPHAPTETVHADESEMKAAIDVAADKIGRALRRNKEKRRDRARATGPVRDPYDVSGSDDDDLDTETATL